MKRKTLLLGALTTLIIVGCSTSNEDKVPDRVVVSKTGKAEKFEHIYSKTNLIKNSGFESKRKDGFLSWSHTGTVVAKADKPKAHSGSRYFMGRSKYTNIKQRINLLHVGYSKSQIDAGWMYAKFGGYVAGIDNEEDRGTILLICYNSNMKLLKQKAIKNPDLTSSWKKAQNYIAIPKKTRYIEYKFSSIRFKGKDSDAYIDDAFLYLTKKDKSSKAIKPYIKKIKKIKKAKKIAPVVHTCKLVKPSTKVTFNIIKTASIKLPKLKRLKKDRDFDFTIKGIENNRYLYASQSHVGMSHIKQEALYDFKSGLIKESNLQYNNDYSTILSSGNIVDLQLYIKPKYVEIRDMMGTVLLNKSLDDNAKSGQVNERYISYLSGKRLHIIDVENFKEYKFKAPIKNSKLESISFSISSTNDIYVAQFKKIYKKGNYIKTNMLRVGRLNLKSQKIEWRVKTKGKCENKDFIVTKNKLVCSAKDIKIFDLHKNRLIRTVKSHGWLSKVSSYNSKDYTIVATGRTGHKKPFQAEVAVININSGECKKVALPKSNNLNADYSSDGIINNRYAELKTYCTMSESDYGCPLLYLDTKTLYMKTLNDTSYRFNDIPSLPSKDVKNQFIPPMYNSDSSIDRLEFNRFEIISVD